MVSSIQPLSKSQSFRSRADLTCCATKLFPFGCKTTKHLEQKIWPNKHKMPQNDWSHSRFLSCYLLTGIYYSANINIHKPKLFMYNGTFWCIDCFGWGKVRGQNKFRFWSQKIASFHLKNKNKWITECWFWWIKLIYMFFSSEDLPLAESLFSEALKLCGWDKDENNHHPLRYIFKLFCFVLSTCAQLWEGNIIRWSILMTVWQSALKTVGLFDCLSLRLHHGAGKPLLWKTEPYKNCKEHKRLRNTAAGHFNPKIHKFAACRRPIHSAKCCQ